ncbi:Lrp/AsnC family transcriptional regulator [Streptomyces sp. NPDC001652]
MNPSPSATTERVRQLEAQGVSTGYQAVMALAKVGHLVPALVRLKSPR